MVAERGRGEGGRDDGGGSNGRRRRRRRVAALAAPKEGGGHRGAGNGGGGRRQPEGGRGLSSPRRPWDVLGGDGRSERERRGLRLAVGTGAKKQSSRAAGANAQNGSA